jgi:hypothetical protein
MRPQDIVVLLKILCYPPGKWYNKDLAADLFLSTAEISNSLQRSSLSGLIDIEKRRVRVLALFEFMVYGLQYVFPQHPGSYSRGIPTAHSHPYMKALFSSDQAYVWPDAESEYKGLSVQPLYPGAISAVKRDEKLYLMLSLLDVLRMGKTREKDAAITKLRELLEL